MSHPRLVMFLGCIALLQAPSMSAQTTVAIAGPTKEERRTAHQLRISVDHLRNAREALKQATDLARRNPDTQTVTQISQHWLRLDRSKAPAVLEDLYAWMRAAARDAADTETYLRNQSAAQGLLRSLATLDPARASALWQRWPDPPTGLDETFRKNQLEAGALFARQLSGQGSDADAPRARDLAQLREQANRGVYPSAAALAMLLNQSGDKTEALQVVDQAIANFGQQEPNPSGIQSYMTFLRQLPSVDPDRFIMGLNSVLPAIDKLGAPNAGGIITVGAQTVQLTGSEAAVIELCRNLFARPELAMRTLSSMPSLKGKLDRVGGIDNIVGASSGRSQTPVSMNYSIDGRSRTTFNASGTGTMLSSTSMNGMAGPNPSSAMELYESVRGKLTQDPAFVRRRLEEASKNPDQIDALIQLANRANYQEPDLASTVLESAARLLPLVEPLQKRATAFQNLMRAYQSCEGEVDAGLLQQGLTLVQQLRSEEAGNAQAIPAAGSVPPGRMAGMADQLEMAIVAEVAQENFTGALGYVRLMPDAMKMQALLRIVQSLMQNY